MEALKEWEKFRLRYNLGLIFAGVGAFICLILIHALATNQTEYEITAFTILLQGFGYLCAMLLANVLFFLGPIAELMARPRNQQVFRKRLFSVGFYFSVLLPFAVPVCAAIFAWG